MAKDRNTDLSTAEFLDALERGQRIYKGFERALEMARRVANLEGAERDLLKRVEEATALCSAVETECAGRKAAAVSEADAAKGVAGKIISEAKAEADKIVQRGLDKSSEALKVSQEAMERHAAIMRENQSALDALYVKINEGRDELKKIEKQLAAARAAKRELLEA